MLFSLLNEIDEPPEMPLTFFSKVSREDEDVEENFSILLSTLLTVMTPFPLEGRPPSPKDEEL